MTEPEAPDGYQITRTTTITQTVYVVGTLSIDHAEKIANEYLDAQMPDVAQQGNAELEWITTTAENAPAGSIILDADGNVMTGGEDE